MNDSATNKYAKAAGDLSLFTLKHQSDKARGISPTPVAPTPTISVSNGFADSIRLQNEARMAQAHDDLASFGNDYSEPEYVSEPDVEVEVFSNSELEIRIGGKTISVSID